MMMTIEKIKDSWFYAHSKKHEYYNKFVELFERLSVKGTNDEICELNS